MAAIGATTAFWRVARPRTPHAGKDRPPALHGSRSDEAGFESTIARVAQAGYQEVEFAGYYNRSPADVRAISTQRSLGALDARLVHE